MLEYGFAESATLVRVANGDLEGCAGHADALGGNADASTFKVGERNAITLAFIPQSIRRRHDHIIEADLAGVGGILPHLFLDAGYAVARRLGVDDESRNAAFTRA